MKNRDTPANVASEAPKTKAIDIVRRALYENPARAAKELVALTGLGTSTVDKSLVTMESQGVAVRRQTYGRGSASWSIAAGSEVVSGQRLGRGELRLVVHSYLHLNAGEDFTPFAIAKSLGRSPGAVANSLRQLEASKSSGVTRSKERPLRYAYR